MNTIPLLLLLILLSSLPAQAQLLMTSKDGTVALNASRLPANVKPGADIINKRCNDCHDIIRIIKPLETGKAADGSAFGKTEAREYVIKKMRRPGVILSQQEAREIIRIMEYILDNVPESGNRQAPQRGTQPKPKS